MANEWWWWWWWCLDNYRKAKYPKWTNLSCLFCRSAGRMRRSMTFPHLGARWVSPWANRPGYRHRRRHSPRSARHSTHPRFRFRSDHVTGSRDRPWSWTSLRRSGRFPRCKAEVGVGNSWSSAPVANVGLRFSANNSNIFSKLQVIDLFLAIYCYLTKCFTLHVNWPRPVLKPRACILKCFKTFLRMF